MNLYLRYFDKETLVHDVDDAIDFLASIQEIGMNPDLEADIRDYVASDVYYPKRYKIRPRVYFIIIKTEAPTMLDFKQKKALRSNPANVSNPDQRDFVPTVVSKLAEQRSGWYEGSLDFKRVVMIPGTCKHEYVIRILLRHVKQILVWIAIIELLNILRRGLITEVNFRHQKERTLSSRILDCGNDFFCSPFFELLKSCMKYE